MQFKKKPLHRKILIGYKSRRKSNTGLKQQEDDKGKALAKMPETYHDGPTGHWENIWVRLSDAKLILLSDAVLLAPFFP